MKLLASLFSLFKHLSTHRRWQLVGLLILMLVSSIAEMATLGAVVPFLALLADPTVANKYPILQIVLFWLGADKENILLSAGIIFCIITISSAMIRVLMMWSSMRFSYGLGADIGAEVYRRTLHQSYSWHVSQNSSEVMSGIDKVGAVVGGILTPLMQSIVAIGIISGILAALITIDWQTALIAAVGFAIIYGITTLTLASKLKNNSQIVAANMSLRLQSVQEGLGGIRDVLLDGTQHVFHSKFVEFDYAMGRAQAANAVIGASPRFIVEAVGMVLIVALAYWLGSREGGLTSAIPVLGALAIGAQKLLPQMQLVYASWSSIIGNSYQLEDVLGFLTMPLGSEQIISYSEKIIKYDKDFEKKILDNDLVSDPNPLIELNNISFFYSTECAKVLRGINLEVFQGSIIGFIGKTGSGKSTLIDLIMGLLEPTSGKIKVNGVHFTEKMRRAWQSRIAHVPQTIYLSDSSMAENIAFGVPVNQIDFQRVKESASRAQLSEFIESLPLGYQTPVGERGVRLSGGQRQRLGLARAFYKKADILIFDEATSALDNLTEKSIMMSIEGLGKDCTILIIAHRLSTLSICDQIFEIDEGSIIGKYLYSDLIIQ